LEEELSWNSSDDEEVGEQTKEREESERDKSDESDDERNEGSDDDSDKTVKAEEETAKDDKKTKETGKGGDEARERGDESEEEKETSEEEEVSFDPIPRTPEDSEKESDDEEEQESRLSEEARIREEEDAEELYHDANINQGRGVESIFTTTSSQSVSLVPPTPILTPSTIATITTSGEALIPPPTIPSIILENLPTFNSAFRFEERLRLLETSFNEYRQTNQVAGAISEIPGIVHQYMDQQMKEAVREAVQKQTD
nr:hypothetical protein [Tanacetum cinerariifolium]